MAGYRPVFRLDLGIVVPSGIGSFLSVSSWISTGIIDEYRYLGGCWRLPIGSRLVSQRSPITDSCPLITTTNTGSCLSDTNKYLGWILVSWSDIKQYPKDIFGILNII